MRFALVALCALATTAHADPLAEARALTAQLEYEKALALVDKTLAAGGADPARFADLHQLAGELCAGLDRIPQAEDHFARALAVRPSTALAAGISPKISGPFDAARSRNRPLVIGQRVASGLVTISPETDPLGIVAGVAVHTVDPAGKHADIVMRASLRAIVPVDASVVEIAALDGAGNRVWVTSDLAAPAKDPIIEPVHRPIIRRWATWTIAATAIAATGAALAYHRGTLQDRWDALRAEDGMHDYSELASLESSGRTYALAANLTLGLAAACAVTAIVLLVVE